MNRLYKTLTVVALSGLFFSVATEKSFSQTANAIVPRIVSLDPALRPFYHGVASGDPLPDAVIIWTRVTPDTGSTGAISVTWRMATDTNFTNIVKNGTETADASTDYTVKVDVNGLQPETTYYYEFTAPDGRNSLIGRTKTAPTGNVDSLRFAVVSCANYEAGFFNTYSAIKKGNDIDAVLALGDYIYEYETGGYAPNGSAGRTWEPANEIISLYDYRTRYSSYHLDPDLRKLHQQYPWIVVWDDHETANDSYRDGAQNHTDSTEGLWSDRKSYGTQAFSEWLPIRNPNPTDLTQIYRKMNYGNLVNLFFLDTRLHGRDKQVTATSPNVNDTSRHILGIEQFEWLKNELSGSTAKWNVLAQQVMVAPLKVFGSPVNMDQWDGYPADRNALYDFVLTNNIPNMVVLTGDIHTSWANDLPTSSYNSTTGAGSAGVEFVATSVTSPGLEQIPSGGTAVTVIKSNNPHIKYVDLTKHGYIILDINNARTQSDWYFVTTVDQPNNNADFATSWYVINGERHLRSGATKSNPRPSLTSIPFAPENPNFPLSINETARPTVILGTYPNPVVNYAMVQFYIEKSSEVNIKVTDVSGKIISNENFNDVSAGLHLHAVDLKNISDGIYFLLIETGNYTATQKLVKAGK